MEFPGVLKKEHVDGNSRGQLKKKWNKCFAAVWLFCRLEIKCFSKFSLIDFSIIWQMIPWLINSMLCRLFFNTDLLHVFRRVPVTNLKITVRSYSHKVYPLKPPCFCLSCMQSFSWEWSPQHRLNIVQMANQKPRNTCLLSLSTHTYLLISSFFLSHLPFTLQRLPFTWYL